MEEALDLSFDRLLMMMITYTHNMSPYDRLQIHPKHVEVD